MGALEIVFFILLVYLFCLVIMSIFIGSRGGRATDFMLLAGLSALIAFLRR